MALMGLVGWAGYHWYRHRTLPDSPRFLKALLAGGPLALVALEAGWIVTEVGRQPWIIYRVMKTEEAVTPVENLLAPLLMYTTIFLVLALATGMLLRREFRLVSLAAGTGEVGENVDAGSADLESEETGSEDAGDDDAGGEDAGGEDAEEDNTGGREAG